MANQHAVQIFWLHFCRLSQRYQCRLSQLRDQLRGKLGCEDFTRGSVTFWPGYQTIPSPVCPGQNCTSSKIITFTDSVGKKVSPVLGFYISGIDFLFKMNAYKL